MKGPSDLRRAFLVSVSVFADRDYAADRGQPQRLVGGTMTGTLLIQVVPQFVDSGTGINVYCNSTPTPSSFTPEPCESGKAG